VAGRLDFTGDGIQHPLQHAACGKSMKSRKRELKVYDRDSTVKSVRPGMFSTFSASLSFITTVLALASCSIIVKREKL